MSGAGYLKVGARKYLFKGFVESQVVLVGGDPVLK